MGERGPLHEIAWYGCIYKLVIPNIDTLGSPNGDREGGKQAR